MHSKNAPSLEKKAARARPGTSWGRLQRCPARLAFKLSQWQAARQKVRPSLVLGLVWEWRRVMCGGSAASSCLPSAAGKKRSREIPQAINSSLRIAVDQSFSRVMWSGRTRRDPSPLPHYLVEKANKIPRKRQEEQWESSRFSKGRKVVDKAACTTLWYSLPGVVAEHVTHPKSQQERGNAHIEPLGYGGGPHTWGWQGEKATITPGGLLPQVANLGPPMGPSVEASRS